MAWLYSKSKTWRSLVDFTRRGPFYLAGFSVICLLGPTLVGNKVMRTTNPNDDKDLEKKLQSRRGIDSQMLAKAQRDRLQVLLDEIKGGGDGERYKAALDGKSLGTHTTGSSINAISIKRSN